MCQYLIYSRVLVGFLVRTENSLGFMDIRVCKILDSFGPPVFYKFPSFYKSLVSQTFGSCLLAELLSPCEPPDFCKPLSFCGLVDSNKK